jgi:hypothetical protein
MTRSKWTGAVMALSFLIGGMSPALAQNSFPTSGPVGVGTPNPTFMLDVRGMNSVPLRLTGRGGTGSNSSQMRFAGQKDGELFAIGSDLMGVGIRDFSVFDLVANTMRLMINPSGNVGIGTSAPAYRLDVRGMSTVAARFTGAAPSMNSTQLRLAGQTDGDLFALATDINGTGARDFQIYDLRAGVARLSIAEGGAIAMAGNVTVTGNLSATGNIAAKYQDVAEWVPVRAAVPPATVVVIDSNNVNMVESSAKAYDTRIAGVVSAQPGVILGEPGSDKVQVAHNGRVKVKVDATYGAIAVGDLLVTSPTPGYAMRSRPVEVGGTEIHRPGTLLGKALEPLSEGSAEILVLLTLQ